MNCRDCQALLQSRLDGEPLSSTPELEQHLAGCARCRQQLAAAQRLLDGLKSMSSLQPPVDLSQRTIARIVEDRRQRQLRMRRRFWATVALAASLLLMAVAGYFWLPNPRPTLAPGPKIVEKKGNFEPLVPAPEPAPSLQQSVEKAGTAVASLTGRLADKTLEQARMLLAATAPPLDAPPMALPGIEQLEEPLEPAAQSLVQTGQGVSDGLQTVTHTARRAVDFFMRELATLDTK